MFGSGNKDAEIAIVEDFPYYVEKLNNKMYLGGTDYTLKTMLAPGRLSRANIWITCLFGEVGKKLRYFYYDKDCTKLKNEYYVYNSLLAKELMTLSKLKIIMPVGNGALQAVAGLKGVSNWRGSIIPISDDFAKNKKNDWKVIPTYSPRDINTNYALRVYTSVDIKRAIKEKDIKGIRRPFRRSVINPTFEQAKAYLEDILIHKRLIATDIEATGHTITCISFATSPWDGISIPFYHTTMKKYWINIEQSNIIEGLVKKIINDPEIPKILQNGMFDFWFMANVGYDPKNLFFDTMYASHCMYCELEKDLGTLTSTYTDEPYYKFERTQAKKEFDREIKPKLTELKKMLSDARKMAKKRATAFRKINRTAPLKTTPKRQENLVKWGEEKKELFDSIKAIMKAHRTKQSALDKVLEEFDRNADITYWMYNTKDSQVTFEIYEKMRKELEEQDLWEFFVKSYIKIFPFAFNISMKGIKIDEARRKKVAEQVLKGLEWMRQEIYKKVGYEFNTESPPQLCKVLYDTLELPPQYSKKGNLTTDAKALDRLIEKTDDPILQDIIDIRKLQKLESTYLNSKLDNGYIRSEINIAGPTSGRWASRQSPWGSGGNLQNIPSGKTDISDRVLKVLGNNKNIIKTCFIPDSDEYIFIEVDLSNAETWYTAFKAKDRVLMDALLAGKDTHRMVGSICYDKPEELINKVERTNAKRVGHGFDYGMMEKTTAATIKAPLSLVKIMYQRLRETRPAIPEYHRDIEYNIMEYKCLVNAWGRKRIFFDRTPFKFVNGKKVATPAEVYRSGYSYIPQSSVADTVGEAIRRFLKLHKMVKGVTGVLQVHDSLLIHCHKSAIYEAIELLWECFDIEQNPWGDPFKIPWDYAIGFNWGEMVELPVKDKKIDYSKNTVTDKETGVVSIAPWVPIIEKIESYTRCAILTREKGVSL